MSLSMNQFDDATFQKFLETHGDTHFTRNRRRAGLSFQDFVLSATQMDTLNATPVTIVAAPGSGLTNICMGLFLKVNSTGFTPFELGSGVLEFRYTDGSGAKLVTDIVNGTVESSTDLISYSPGIVSLAIENAVICAHTSTDVTSGTGNIQGRLWYTTVKVSEIV